MRDVFFLCLLAVLAEAGQTVQREHPSMVDLLPQGANRAHTTYTGLTVTSEVVRVLAALVRHLVEFAQGSEDLGEPGARVVEQVPADEVDVAARGHVASAAVEVRRPCSAILHALLAVPKAALHLVSFGRGFRLSSSGHVMIVHPSARSSV